MRRPTRKHTNRGPDELQQTMRLNEARERARRLGCACAAGGLASALALAGTAQGQSLHAHTPSNQIRSSLPAPPAKPVAAPDDGLSGGGFYIEADVLTQNDTTHHVTASGSVEARYKGRVLRADSVDYDTRSQIVVARGHVQILDADGTAQFGDTITLDKTMSTGFAAGFSARLQGDVKVAAERAHRRGDEVTEFDRAIYTPCPACNVKSGIRPTWSIRAVRVVEDKRRKTLTFHHAIIQVKGVGVFYLPVMQTADPSAERKSGLFLPLVTFSGERGFSYAQSYYQVISPSQDVTITPQINSRVNPFLNVEWRKRFYSGETDIRAGYTYDRDFTSGGSKFGPATSRSYILGDGQFQISKDWQWGFTAERTSDPLLFDKYSITDVYRDRGLYAVDDRRLISQLYVVRQDQLSFLSVAAISIQGLRSSDVQSTIPTVAPLIEARFEPAEAILGGRLRLFGSAVALTEDQATAGAVTIEQNTTPTLVPGTDSRRATAQADWQRTFTFSNGLRISPFLDGRADVYSLSDSASEPSNGTITRAFGWVGANISYPLFRQSGGATWILEPMAQVAVAPNTKPDPRIPNEDSVDFQFDETNLFEFNRSPGFDLYEGGQSITLGGRATVLLPDGRSGSIILGRRFGAENDYVIPARTGLQSELSDYVLAGDFTLTQAIRFYSRLRLNSDGLGLDYLETGANFSLSRVSGYISYLQEAQAPDGLKVQSLDLHGETFLTKHWGVSAYAIIDGGAWRRRDFGVIYRDSCIRVEVLYRHDETFNGTLGPSTSVLLRLSLATLGNTH